MSILSVSGLTSGYGGGSVLHGVDLSVNHEQIVTVLGPNGAGKSTLFETIYGFLKPDSGMVTYHQNEITGEDPEELVAERMVYVPQGTNVFKNMTVMENLQMAAYLDDCSLSEAEREVFELFPRLDERTQQKAGTMSGGEQQMLELACGLIAGDMEPDLLLLDEPSTGLAPKIVDQVFERIEAINDRGTTILLVEQKAQRALDLTDYAYILDNGNIQADGSPAEIRRDNKVQETYLG